MALSRTEPIRERLEDAVMGITAIRGGCHIRYSKM
jgi:hypothetical protein